MDWAALAISVIALFVAGLAARYALRQARAVERQNELEHEAVLRFVSRFTDSGDIDGTWVPSRSYIAIENVGRGRAVDVRIVLDMDKAGRTYGTVKKIDVVEPSSEAELKTEKPLPQVTQLFVNEGGRISIEQAEVRWLASDGTARRKRLPLVS